MKFLRAALLLASLAFPAGALAASMTLQAPLPPSRDLYSFADLYRLSVGEPALAASAQPAGATFLVRAAAESPAATAASPYVFSVRAVSAPSGGLLVLAGLAAALWVARRRLGYAIRG